MVWYSHLFMYFLQFVVIHTVKGFGIVNKAKDVFLEFSCFFHDLADVGNLISGSSAFSKTSLNIREKLYCFPQKEEVAFGNMLREFCASQKPCLKETFTGALPPWE